MTKLTLIKSKSLDEQIEEELTEIQLPLFEIIVHNDDTEESWFREAIKHLEENDSRNT